MVRCAVALGAAWHPRSPVQRVEQTPDGVALHLAGGTHRARAVVVAAGGWLGPLLDGVVALPPLTVLQTQVFHFPRRDPSARWPTFIQGTPAGEFYGLPGGRDGGPDEAVKLGEHRGGTVTTADARTGVIDPAARERVVAHVRRFLPGPEPAVYSETSCDGSTRFGASQGGHGPARRFCGARRVVEAPGTGVTIR
jgi:glycine/D-amino acid oxidase-like deaminating enzyme